MKVIELFAGIGGFRVGLSKSSEKFNFVWSNQFEPGKKNQFAYNCYINNFGIESCVNKDINEVNINSIPDFDLLTAGFPCQDYSVAKSLKNSHGIEGKKGVLWWNIHKIIECKRPSYILLENVDRLIVSPSKQKGKDFSIILNCLMSLGYFVEWKIINAADYGMPQKRKRIFIFASKNEHAILASAFKHTTIKHNQFQLNKDIMDISNNFGIKNNDIYFDYGIANNFNISTFKTKPIYSGKYQCLKDIILDIKDIEQDYFINEEEIEKWKPFKLGRSIERMSKDGFSYLYKEGKMSFPDSLDKPARTIITAEGGKTPSRFKHVILQNNQYRRLHPIELERIQMFPDNHTKTLTPNQRAFVLGNALVTGIITKIGDELLKIKPS